MSNHTQGEWHAGRPDMQTIVDGYPSKWIYAGDKYVAVASGQDIEDWEEVMANAHLIAAAPALLEAAEKAHDALCRFCGIDDETRPGWALKALDEAIAKAQKGHP